MDASPSPCRRADAPRGPALLGLALPLALTLAAPGCSGDGGDSSAETQGTSESGSTSPTSGAQTETSATTQGPSSGASMSTTQTGMTESGTDATDTQAATGTSAGSETGDSDPLMTSSGDTIGTTTGATEATSMTGMTGMTGMTDMTGMTGTTDTSGTTGMNGTNGTNGTTGMNGTTDGDAIPEWLLSINNQTHWLQKIDIYTAETTNLCQLNTNSTYTSLTFSRENNLFASRGSSFLDQIDPCDCAITPIGSYGGYTGVAGLTSDQDVSLYGVASTQDVLLAVDTESGQGDEVGPLMVNFGNQGATWSDTLGDLYAINANTDFLYQVDHLTGTATPVVALSINFSTVGIELHPGNDVIYACTGNSTLYTVDPNDGQTLPVGQIDQTQCSNLAAPYKTVACIP